MQTVRILDVGECGFDGPRMARLWREQLHAHVDSADSADDAIEAVAQNEYDLILVNRVLAFTHESGLEVIESLLESDSSLQVMLVSDLPEAQQAATQLGAMPGFGKSQLGDEATLQRLGQIARHESA